MAQQKKTTPVATPASASAPVPTTKTAAAPVAAPPADDAASTNVDTVADDVAQRFTKFNESLVAITAAVKEMQTLLKTLQKDYAKNVKAASKKGRKNTSGTKRTPSGFAKPTDLSKELTDFLGLPSGTQKARTDVTRMLNEYIKKNNLQNPKDKRKIDPDANLKKLMKLTDKDTLTYFNLQSHIKHHFVKTA